MLDLAQHKSDGFVPLKDVAIRQNISKKYLEQIIVMLNKPEIILTNRGFQGGYKLAQEPSAYKLGDILRLTEGSLATVSCTEQPDICERNSFCLTMPVWKKLNTIIYNYVDNISLQDILDHKI
jgi:Rrf2 family protein